MLLVVLGGYHNQTRSLLKTDQITASIDSTLPSMEENAGASATIYFGPKLPPGQKGSSVQTMPGKLGTSACDFTARSSRGRT